MKIYTDGSCFPNPNGAGGWAFCVIKDEDVVYTQSGRDFNTTNNRMELMAILKAAEWVKDKGIEIYTDSKYCQSCIMDWYESWRVRGVLDERQNIDLIEEAHTLCKAKNITIQWVKGHNGDPHNEYSDYLSNKEMADAYKEYYGTEINADEVSLYWQKKHELRKKRKEAKGKKQKGIKVIAVKSKRPSKKFDARVLQFDVEKEIKKEKAVKRIAKQQKSVIHKPFVFTKDMEDKDYIIINNIKYKKLKR